MKRLVLSSIVMGILSSSVYAQGYSHKIDKCILIYSEASNFDGSIISSGNGFLNLKNINEMIVRKYGIKFIFGKNSTTVEIRSNVDKTQAINAFRNCSIE